MNRADPSAHFYYSNTQRQTPGSAFAPGQAWEYNQKGQVSQFVPNAGKNRGSGLTNGAVTGVFRNFSFS
jgi:hypothetical protein